MSAAATPPTALDTAQALFLAEGLPWPPVPPALAAHLQQLKPWTFGTRAAGPDLYDLPAWVAEVEAGPVEDYVIFGHAGYGTNTWALHFYLVSGPLALFVQTAWGGIYTDNAAAEAQLARQFAAAAALLAAPRGRLGPTQRLAVVDAAYHQQAWAALPEAWQPDPDPLAAAARWLTQPPTP